MALVDQCILWNKLGSNAEVDASEIGVNGTRSGTVQYAAGKFGNGTYNNTTVNFITFTNGNTSPNAGIISGWWKPGYDSNSAVSAEIIAMNKGGEWFECYWRGSHKQIAIYFYEGSYQSFYSFNYTFSTDDLMHVAIVYDKDESANNRIKLYIDGVQVSLASAASDGAWDFNTQDILLKNINGDTNAVFDNIKVFDDPSVIAEVLANRNTENFYEPTYKIDIPVKTKPVYNKKVIIKGIDLYQELKINQFPDIEYRKGFDKSRLYINELEIPCKNEDLYFAKDNPKSPFSNGYYYKADAACWDRENHLIYEGKLFDIWRKYPGGSGLVLKNDYYSDRYSRIAYSSGWEDGATIFEKVCAQNGITNLNEAALNRSKGILQNAGCDIKLTVTKDDNKNLLDVLEIIARNSCAYVYDFKGEIFFQVYEPVGDRIITKTITANETGIIKNVDVSCPDKYLINDYAIHYDGDGGTALIDSNADNIGNVSRTQNGTHTLNDVTGDDIIEFQDSGSAQFIGEAYIRRTHKNLATKPEPLQLIKYTMMWEKVDWIDLTTFYKFNFSPENWIDKKLEIFRIKYRDRDNIVELDNYEISS